jgi:hypothetical protein
MCMRGLKGGHARVRAHDALAHSCGCMVPSTECHCTAMLISEFDSSVLPRVRLLRHCTAGQHASVTRHSPINLNKCNLARVFEVHCGTALFACIIETVIVIVLTVTSLKPTNAP